jgi:RimJ/RimL family protein N-acetyltransferase
MENGMTTFRKGPRVTLRLPLVTDAPIATELINDPAVSDNLTIYLPKPLQSQEAFFGGANLNGSKDVILVMEVSGEFIGMMGLHDIDHRHGTATTGAWMGRPFQGKGYGVEAKMLLLEYAFNTLNLRKVCSNVFEFNSPSLKYSGKCGYKEEGRLRKHIFARGQYWDKVQLAVFREDFLPLWEVFKHEHGAYLMTS